MKWMKILLFACLGLGLHIPGVQAQDEASGCPRIDIGGGDSKDTVLECGTDCITLTAEVLETGQTDDYNVQGIPFAPPYPFNVGNPIFVGVDDIWSNVLNLPFEFCFYGKQYNQVVVGANGVLTFDLGRAGNTCCWCMAPGTTIPTPNNPTCPGAICAQSGVYDLSINGAFHDMDPSKGGNIYWDVLGDAPCRTFVLNYNDVPQFSCNGLRSTSQIVLYENTNVIDVYIGQRQVCGGWNDGLAVIGLQNEGGTQAIAAPGRNTSAWAANNEAWRFTPDVAGAPNYIISWYDMDGNLLLDDNKDFVACLPADQVDSSYQARVEYTICDGATINVWDTITLVREVPMGLTVTPDSVEFCEGDSVLVELRNGVSYEWSPDPQITDVNDSNQVLAPTTIDGVSISTYVYPFRVNYPGACYEDSQVVVTVYPIPQLEGDTVEVCRGDTALLGASGVNVDDYEWKAEPEILSFRFSDSVTVYSEASKDFTVYGYSDFGCPDTHIVHLRVKNVPEPDAGPDRLICGLEDSLYGVSQFDNSTRRWYHGEGIPGIVYQDSLLDTTWLSVPNSGDYSFFFEEELEGCIGTDTVDYTFFDIPTPFAGVDDSACGDFYFMDAIPSIGLGNWTNPDGLASIGDPGDPQTIIYVTPFNGIVTMIWTEYNGTCEVSDTVVIQFFDLPPADAGTDQEVCDLTATLNAQPGGGTGTWTAVDQQGNPISPVFFPNENDPNATATVTDYDSITYSWTVDLGVCQSEDRVLVVYRETPNANAGLDDTTCLLCYDLMAIPSVGDGQWTSNTTATFNDASAAQTQVCVNNFGIHSFYWTETNGICIDTDTVEINFFDTPTIEAGPDQNVCGFDVDLSGSLPGPTGTGTWSTFSLDSNRTETASYLPNANNENVSATVPYYGCYRFYWTIDYKFCSVMDSVDVCFYEQPIANAGVDDTVCSQYYTLNAQPSSGSGMWTSNCPAVFFDNPTDPNSGFLYDGYGCCQFYWTEINGNCTDVDTVEICLFETPVASINTVDYDTCGFTATVVANPSVGNGTWFSNNPNISFGSPNSSSTTVNASLAGYGTYTVFWTEDNQGCRDTSSIDIGFYETPKSDAGTNDSICGLNYQMNAVPSVGVGTWSGPAGIVFNSPNSPTSGVTATNYGAYTLTWKEQNGPCIDSSVVTITFFEQPIANAGSAPDFCALTGSLNALASVGNGQWTGPVGTIFGTPNNPSTTVDVTTLGYGTYTFWWKEVNVICEDSASITVNFYEQPLANAGQDDSVCGNDYTLNAISSVGTGVWTSPCSSITFSDPNNPNSTVSNSAYTCCTLIWTETNGSCSDVDSVEICFFEDPMPYAGPDEQFCGEFYRFKASPAVGIGEWLGPQGAVYSNVNDPNSTIDIGSIGVGNYDFVWKDSNQICVSYDTVNLTFLGAPEAICNCDEEVIYTDYPFYHFEDLSPRASVWYWDFGDGNSSNLPQPTHEYTALGTYQVTLYIEDQFGCDSSTSCTIRLEDRLRVYVPTAFTPNNDHINDYYRPSIVGHLPDTYTFEIYDRWGKLIFRTMDPEGAWDGTIETGLDPCPMGTYTYLIKYTDYKYEDHVLTGSVTLLR